ncbi:MAG: HesA/MoeB/ThiF family protein [Candidatus Pelagadaptatus aseana]|uniref:ThiF family adenylyltransferase n=1 Tax=Candidatus Pelagadaptatus aseana TaxID=3120508 RepID=UPI0039B1D517
MTDLSERQQLRYQRHCQLPGFGEAGQQRLQQSHILIIGMGGLGCPAALYLAAAGVGKLTLVDGDQVSLSNLQRQVLFTEADIGRSKVVAAAERLSALNSDITIEVVASHLTLDNAPALIEDCDLVLDCTDNFHSRYLINDLCHFFQTPWLYSSVLGFNGQLALFDPAHSCFRCLFPELSEVPDCNQAGVLGVVPGTLGSFQASEAINYLANLKPYDTNRLQQYSALENTLRSIKLHQSDECPLCSQQQTYKDLIDDYQPSCQLVPDDQLISPQQLTQFIATHQPQLIDVRSPDEHHRHNIGGRNIPLPLMDKTDDLNPDTWYLLYCQSGVRSQKALQILLEKGYSQLRSLQGGLDALQKEQ